MKKHMLHHPSTTMSNRCIWIHRGGVCPKRLSLCHAQFFHTTNEVHIFVAQRTFPAVAWHPSSGFLSHKSPLWHFSHVMGCHCDMTLMWHAPRATDRKTDMQTCRQTKIAQTPHLQFGPKKTLQGSVKFGSSRKWSAVLGSCWWWDLRVAKLSSVVGCFGPSADSCLFPWLLSVWTVFCGHLFEGMALKHALVWMLSAFEHFSCWFQAVSCFNHMFTSVASLHGNTLHLCFWHARCQRSAVCDNTLHLWCMMSLLIKTLVKSYAFTHDCKAERQAGDAFPSPQWNR